MLGGVERDWMLDRHHVASGAELEVQTLHRRKPCHLAIQCIVPVVNIHRHPWQHGAGAMIKRVVVLVIALQLLDVFGRDYSRFVVWLRWQIRRLVDM